MNYRKLLLDFRLRRKDTLCCARIEIVPSIASYVAKRNLLPFRHFARLFVHF
jgi:hypothetical protein